MAMDWKEMVIEVPRGTDNWGPYTFDFKDVAHPLIPENNEITSVEVKAYNGLVDKNDDYTTATEITDYIIDGFSVVDGQYVNVYFQHNEAASGTHTLIFFVNIDQPDSVRPFYFYGVKIY